MADFRHFTKGRFPSVVEFALDVQCCSDDVAVSALRRVPNAKHVLVATAAPRSDTYTLKAMANKEDMICPKMTHFTLGTTSKRLTLPKSVVDLLIMKLLDNRASTGNDF